MTLWNKIKTWFLSLGRVTAREAHLTLTDAGALLFFMGLPLAYPIVYTLIYNPEVAREINVAVVDDSRTQVSREFVRMADATESMHIIGYASDMAEARRWKDAKDCYGIIYIPSDYATRLGRGEQAHVAFYSDMTLLLRYRSMLLGLTNLQLAAGENVRNETISSLGVTTSSGSTSPIENASYIMGDTEQGFASFVIPGIIILILQQSMVLGITLIGGTRAERRRANGGRDPREIPASASATVIGRMLWYVILYLPLTLYVLHFIPWMFALPHIGSPLQYMPYALPLLVSTAFFAMTVQLLVKEREMSLMVVVFTSVVFLFLSGLTWPRYAMGWFWTWLGDLIPAVWGIEGFIRINSNGATLAQNATPYLMMWALAAIYFFTSMWVTRYQRNAALRHS